VTIPFLVDVLEELLAGKLLTLPDDASEPGIAMTCPRKYLPFEFGVLS
jgi:hypothetical protein